MRNRRTRSVGEHRAPGILRAYRHKQRGRQGAAASTGTDPGKRAALGTGTGTGAAA